MASREHRGVAGVVLGGYKYIWVSGWIRRCRIWGWQGLSAICVTFKMLAGPGWEDPTELSPGVIPRVWLSPERAPVQHQASCFLLLGVLGEHLPIPHTRVSGMWTVPRHPTPQPPADSNTIQILYLLNRKKLIAAANFGCNGVITWHLTQKEFPPKSRTTVTGNR